MYDLEVPKASYDRETDKLKQQIQSLEDNPHLNPLKKKKDIERTRLLLEKLLEEQLKQDQHVSRTRSCLDAEKDQWFHSNQKKMEMTAQLFQFCLFPRSVFTASDALFSAKFVHVLHTLKTPNFSTLICYDRIFGDISYTMSSCTENEASHFGVFLSCLLETVMRWHRDRNLFDKECASFPGFATKFTDDVPTFIDYEDYRHVCHKWHYRLTKALILCLDSEDYIQVRNSLLVLTKIISHFPVITTFANSLEKRVDSLRNREKDNRKDLYALATAYVGQLKARKSTFVAEQDFHFKEMRKPPQPTQNENSKETPIKVKQEETEKTRVKSVKQEGSPPSSNHTSYPDKRVKEIKQDHSSHGQESKQRDGSSNNSSRTKKEASIKQESRGISPSNRSNSHGSNNSPSSTPRKSNEDTMVRSDNRELSFSRESKKSSSSNPGYQERDGRSRRPKESEPMIVTLKDSSRSSSSEVSRSTGDKRKMSDRDSRERKKHCHKKETSFTRNDK